MGAGPATPWKGPDPSGTVVRWYTRDQREIEALIQTSESLMMTESAARKADYLT